MQGVLGPLTSRRNYCVRTQSYTIQTSTSRSYCRRVPASGVGAVLSQKKRQWVWSSCCISQSQIPAEGTAILDHEEGMLGDQAWGSDVPGVSGGSPSRLITTCWCGFTGSRRTMLDCQDGAWHSSRIVSKWSIDQDLPMAMLTLSPVVRCPVQQTSLSQEKGGGVWWTDLYLIIVSQLVVRSMLVPAPLHCLDELYAECAIVACIVVVVSVVVPASAGTVWKTYDFFLSLFIHLWCCTCNNIFSWTSDYYLGS
jgi:hypothetical protein